MSKPTPSAAILGAGAMGEALAGGLLRAGWPSESLTLAARREMRARKTQDWLGCRCLLDPAEALRGKDAVVVTVKPKDVSGLLEQIVGHLEPGQVLITFAAGVPTGTFEDALGQVPVIRAMPNIPSSVGEGIAPWAAGRFVDDHARACFERLLGAVGEILEIEEPLLDAVTAVSGTGPAYAFLLAEAMIESAIREGLPRDVAEHLVHHTIKGAGRLLVQSGEGPAELRARVTSPGGTTAAAVHVLEEHGFRALVEDAVRAAARRSRELGAGNAGEGSDRPEGT